MSRLNSFRLFLFRLISIVIMLAVLAGSFYIYTPKKPDSPALSAPDDAPDAVPEPTPEEDIYIAVPPETAPPASAPDLEPLPEEPEPPAGPVFLAADGSELIYSWGDSVPESAPADDSWFSDAAFIGNSLCDGLMLFGSIREASFFCAQSINVQNIYTEKCINAGGGEYITILDALARGSYKKVFIMLGINEVFRPTDWFYEHYSELIDTVRELEPEAEIYLQAILPVTAQKSSSGNYNRKNVLAQNEQIVLLCEEKNAYYIDLFAFFADDDGYLPAGDSSDGVHLTRACYQLWSDYLKSHTITEATK